MRLSIGRSFGPFRLSQTLWRSKPYRAPATWFTHPGCDVHHRTVGAAERCRYGDRQ